ncbi:MAG TPA: hypothetical protein VFW11_09550 [Cyclobacteriaceae bacterium]|nr:hypothetical protein [Cyclobacteriaceae bacterium]
MISKIIFTSIISVGFLNAYAQTRAADTVVVKLGKASQVVLTIQDRNDIEALKQYDFQSLFSDIISKIESNDTTPLVNTNDSLPSPGEEERLSLESDNDNNTNDDDWDDHWDNEWSGKKRWRTTQSFNFDLGTNNYLSNGKFPDSENAPYSVRPWGSWYVAFNSIQRTRIGNNFFLEWGGGVSWYNFKFQDDNIVMQKDDAGTTFVRDENPELSYKKSKLTVTYINAQLIPMLDFGGDNYKPRIWDGRHSAFRIGAGPYIGYKIDSYSKVKYKNDEDTKKDKDHDSYYIDNIRYGIRMQLGFHSTDLFFNYDMNELFTEGKGPSLNAFSFGVIF